MQRVSGLLFFLGGVVMFMGIITAEIFYPPGYSISLNMISNLGSTRPPHSIINEPSAGIFDISLMIAGLLVIGGGFLIKKFAKKRLIYLPLLLMGVGTLGVGIFPAFHRYLHPVVALVAFLFGGLAAITSTPVIRPPFKYLSIILGAITLTALGLGIVFTNLVVPILGAGGIERWVAYPCMLWLIGFGGYLMGQKSLNNSK